MNICFFDNGNLGLLFGEIGKELIERNHNVYILCLSEKKAMEIKELYGIETLLLNLTTANKDSSIIEELEKNTDFKLNKAILIDRILRELPFEKARALLVNYAYQMEELIKKHSLECIFGEITWGVEYLLYYLMQYNKKEYYNPLNTYVTPGRFLFLNAKSDSNFINKEPDEQSIDISRKIMKERMLKDINKDAKFLRTPIPPNFMNRMRKYLALNDNQDYRYSLSYKKKTLEKFLIRQHISFKSSGIFSSFKQLKQQFPNSKFALLALHVQPEATPDVIAPEFSNQLELTKNIARNLPSEYILFIKEHPNGIGSRTIDGLNEFRKIPNAYLLDPYEPMNSIMPEIDVIFTIGGTVSVEASLMGKKSFIFSDIYYSIFPGVQKINEFSSLPQLLEDKSLNTDKEKLEQENVLAYAYIYKNSYEGTVYDPLLMPRVLEKDNIKNLVESFDAFISNLRC